MSDAARRALVEELVGRALAQDLDPDGLRRAIAACLPDLDALAFVRQVRVDPDWSFAAYELGGRVCAKPPERAAALLELLVTELVQERREP
jgi:hypothetical protein